MCENIKQVQEIILIVLLCYLVTISFLLVHCLQWTVTLQSNITVRDVAEIGIIVSRSYTQDPLVQEWKGSILCKPRLQISIS